MKISNFNKSKGWKRVIDELPVIPKGKFGIQVLVAEFDACFDEIAPGKGYDVHVVSYAFTYDRHGKKLPMYEGTDIEADFMTLYIGDNNTEHGPTGDQVTHWMYIPEPPAYDPEVLNPIFQWEHDHSQPQSELKQI